MFIKFDIEPEDIIESFKLNNVIPYIEISGVYSNYHFYTDDGYMIDCISNFGITKKYRSTLVFD